MSDEREFFEQVEAPKPPESPIERRKRRIERIKTEMAMNVMNSPTDLDEKEEEVKEGQVCQYSRIGTGYIPTTATIKTLPPDCYRISSTPNNQIYLDPQNLTTDSLLRLPDSKSDEVIAEVERFWTLKDKFTEYGFSHKRGFMLYGPPGSGKTSTIAIIVGDMVKAGGIVILADHPGFLGAILSLFRQVEPERPLVVIWEDLDAVIENYGESMVLSILDGESQVENVVFIATTNYPEKLDGRIVNRPSRFDRIVKIGMPNDEARKLYLEYKLPKESPETIAHLVKETKDLSIAHLRELIVSVYCQGNDTESTLKRLKAMRVQPKSGSSGGPMGIGFSE